MAHFLCPINHIIIYKFIFKGVIHTLYSRYKRHSFGCLVIKTKQSKSQTDHMTTMWLSHVALSTSTYPYILCFAQWSETITWPSHDYHMLLSIYRHRFLCPVFCSVEWSYHMMITWLSHVTISTSTDPYILCFAQWSENLTAYYQEQSNRTGVGSLFFGSSKGALRFYPGKKKHISGWLPLVLWKLLDALNTTSLTQSIGSSCNLNCWNMLY